MGSATRSNFKDSPVTAFKLEIKKSAYLQYPRRPRLSTIDAVKKSFDRVGRCAFFSINRPKRNPCKMLSSINRQNLGSPQA